MSAEKIIVGEEEVSNSATTSENSHATSRADRRSGVDRRNSRSVAYEKEERRSGKERRSGVDRRTRS